MLLVFSKRYLINIIVIKKTNGKKETGENRLFNDDEIFFFIIQQYKETEHKQPQRAA